MPEEIINIKNLNHFNQISNDFKDKIVVINFWSNWCQQCKSFFEIYDKLYQEYNNSFLFAKVNVSENLAIPRLYQVSWIPTIIFIKNKVLIKKIPGLANYDSLKIVLEKIKSNM